uniref:HAT C-terminal dimerisation domain-containing protein n=1 Tax=Tetraodon nigroviridis TaxID=99883 RepID=H3D389_TETNG
MGIYLCMSPLCGFFLIRDSFVEGAGFRSFMKTISPEYGKLSQRALGLQLYDEVERTIKPQLIRDLKASIAKDAEGAVHVTLDLWAGHGSSPAEDPILVVRIHFVSESWQLRRPTVAFRHLAGENLGTAVAKELEAVLLSYGVFPNNVGVILTNQAKDTLAKNSLFCNYKVMCSSNRGDPDADGIVAFVSDQMLDTDSPFSELQMGTKTTCAAIRLQLVIKEALRNSRVVENLLMQVHNVVAFFRSNAYWSEVLFRECNVSLCPSSSGHRWNSMIISLRRMSQESAWSKVMSVLAQARIEASDAASAPPLIMVKREQVLDILAHLELFSEAIQVLQGNGVTISYIIPSLIGLDKALETLDTNYTHFNRALRTGLCTHFQDLIHQNEMIIATVLDPRIKLQPFPDAKLEEPTEFLMPPSKCKARTTVEARLGSSVASAAPKEAEQDDAAKELKVEEDVQKDKHTDELIEVSSDSSDDMAEGDHLKRKSIFNFLQPPAKAVKMSELDVYLSEPLVESSSSLSYWKCAAGFPQLQRLSRKLLAVPATSGGFDRLYPMAACIVRARRNHLPPHTTERLLLYKNSLNTKVVKKSIGVSKA